MRHNEKVWGLPPPPKKAQVHVTKSLNQKHFSISTAIVCSILQHHPNTPVYSFYELKGKALSRLNILKYHTL